MGKYIQHIKRYVNAVYFDPDLPQDPDNDIAETLQLLEYPHHRNDGNLMIQTPKKTVVVHPGQWLIVYPDKAIEVWNDSQFMQHHTKIE